MHVYSVILGFVSTAIANTTLGSPGYSVHSAGSAGHVKNAPLQFLEQRFSGLI